MSTCHDLELLQERVFDKEVSSSSWLVGDRFDLIVN